MEELFDWSSKGRIEWETKDQFAQGRLCGIQIKCHVIYQTDGMPVHIKTY